MGTAQLAAVRPAVAPQRPGGTPGAPRPQQDALNCSHEFSWLRPSSARWSGAPLSASAQPATESTRTLPACPPEPPTSLGILRVQARDQEEWGEMPVSGRRREYRA